VCVCACLLGAQVGKGSIDQRQLQEEQRKLNKMEQQLTNLQVRACKPAWWPCRMCGCLPVC